MPGKRKRTSPSSVTELQDRWLNEPAAVSEETKREEMVSFISAKRAYSVTISDVVNFMGLNLDNLVILLFLEVIFIILFI